MPALLGKDLPDEEIWKRLSYVRSFYHREPSKII
jgi:hypothetical protein